MAKNLINLFSANKVQFFILLLSATVVSCFEVGETYSKLPPGPWRAVLKLDPEKNYLQTVRHETKVSDNISFDEVTEGDLPFNFEVVYDDPDNFHIVISNADEKIILENITFRKDRATNKDTLTIHFPPMIHISKLFTKKPC
ncbi:MAG: hypothetical protein IPL46_31060 [Saprospiraceae bacterium]|nr:hypothetical protein [Saprospiraceae bacterium]